jgi:predicted Fe-S protein YdhL (DUF1289 family)
MSDVTAASAVPSPCQRLCTLDAEDVCMGCGRTIAEICGWSAMDDPARRRVLEQAERRVAPYRARFPQAYR